MILLDKPYVSDFLIETIKKNDFNVLDNEISSEHSLKTCSTSDAVKKYETENELFYTNSENSIDWIAKNLSGTKLAEMIKISKDKVLFRKLLKSVYPNYYFEEVSYSDLDKINPSIIKFPIVLKPSTGFLSFGVYPINSIDEWNSTLQNLKTDFKKLEGIFPKSVVDMKKFIIEEMIQGDEFALDAYFDDKGNAVILNIFHHPFFDGKDVSDRVYFTSKEIIEKYLDKFTDELNKINKALNFKNFPFHLELRTDDKKITPIEINPLRFCGWCITDIAHYCWGINVYEFFLNQLKPDWKKILENDDNSIYYFTMGDVPTSVDREKIKNIDYEKYLSNIKNPLTIRKTDYINNPIFAIVFAKTKSLDEIKNLLKLDMKEFINI